MTFAGALLVPADAAAPPDQTWGPMLVVALVVVAVVVAIIGFGRITRRRRSTDATQSPGVDAPDRDTSTDGPLPTDPPEGRP